MKTGAEASRTERAAVSFLGAFLGWCMAYWGYAAYQVQVGGFGRVTDFAAMLFWPAAHIFVWWLVFVLPVVMLVDPRHWMFRISVFPFALGLYALVGYMILLAWAGLSFHVHFQIYASVVGVVTGLTYSVEIQTRIAGRVLALLRLQKSRCSWFRRCLSSCSVWASGLSSRRTALHLLADMAVQPSLSA